MISTIMQRADAVVRDRRYAPRWGWHENHAENDRKPSYLPAVQQCRSEFLGLAIVIDVAGLLGGSCLQLGVGPCLASHYLWQTMFAQVISIDWNAPEVDGIISGNTQDPAIAARVASTSYDFLFIDAGHKYNDVAVDHAVYAPMVRNGGIVAFHDALKRKTYEDEIEVWKFLDQTALPTLMIGDEIGTAYYVKEKGGEHPMNYRQSYEEGTR